MEFGTTDKTAREISKKESFLAKSRNNQEKRLAKMN
jgi:hypothetical protein